MLTEKESCPRESLFFVQENWYFTHFLTKKFIAGQYSIVCTTRQAGSSASPLERGFNFSIRMYKEYRALHGATITEERNFQIIIRVPVICIYFAIPSKRSFCYFTRSFPKLLGTILQTRFCNNIAIVTINFPHVLDLSRPFLELFCSGNKF